MKKLNNKSASPPTPTSPSHCLRWPACGPYFHPLFKFFSAQRQLKFIHQPPLFSKKGRFWTMISCISFLCIFKVYLQNQSKQCVKGSYIIRYWSTVDGMWCFIYYHLDVNKGYWGEICNHNFQPLKLIKQDFSNFFVVTSQWPIWHILQRVLLILSELNQKD